LKIIIPDCGTGTNKRRVSQKDTLFLLDKKEEAKLAIILQQLGSDNIF